VSFAPEILADVPFGLSNNISIQVFTEGYGNSLKMKYAILKKGLTSGMSKALSIMLLLLLVLFLILGLQPTSLLYPCLLSSVNFNATSC